MSSRNSLRLFLCAALWLACLVPSLAFAQTVKTTSSVLAAASAEQVRFTALGETTQMRLEIFSLTGEQFYDSDFKLGNLLDWNLFDQQGQRLLDGSYRCLVTTKTLAGQLSQKHGLIVLQTGQATLQPPDQEALTVNAAAPLRREDFLTIVGAGTNWPLTLLAHDGERARLVSGRGGLSFRTGDFFTGKEQEQMQLTPDGKLGLGVVEPQAKLDVGGLIRTAEGIVFPDGSIQTTAYVAASRSLDGRARTQRDAQGRALAAADEPEKLAAAENKVQLAPNISGSGTTNRLTKWIDGPGGVVGDSVITEVGGNIGIGTTTPQTSLDYKGSLAPFFTRDIGTTNFGTAQSAMQLGVSNLGARNAGVGPSMLFFGENSAGNKSFLGRVSAVWENPTAGAEAGALFFQVRANSGDVSALTERMRITSSGNVGIGTATPNFPLSFPNTLGDKIALWGQGGHHYGFGIQGSLLQIHSAGSGDDIAFGYGNSAAFFEVMRIKGTGNVGIGTNNPSSLLHVTGNVITAVKGISTVTGGNGVVGEANTGAAAYGVLGQSSSGFGVVGAITGGSGAGVRALGNGATSIALQIGNGGIKVSGAGLGTSTPVFIHQATVDNISGGTTTIDHPLTNGNSDAILIVTPNLRPCGGFVVNPHPIGVDYLTSSNKWVIYNQDGAAMPACIAFNVLVIKP